VIVMAASGIACSLGVSTRRSAIVFAATLAFVALSDRVSAFTVSKMSPVVVLAIALSPAGSRLGWDAWRRRLRGAKPSKRLRRAESLRFFQLLLVIIYSSSGIAKARGDWLTTPLVLWTQLHDTYQTAFSFALAQHLPGWSWTVMQGAVLMFEMGAPLWFGWSRARPFAFPFGLGMHAMIGVMFGPVLWFALLMMTLLVGGYAPESWLAPVERLAQFCSAPRMTRQRKLTS
ncbi:MAG: HTTM domain-containing protein, partial [Polyangiaceae bacterium]